MTKKFTIVAVLALVLTLLIGCAKQATPTPVPTKPAAAATQAPAPTKPAVIAPTEVPKPTAAPAKPPAVAPIVIKLSHSGAATETYFKQVWANKFKALTEEAFPGRVKVEIYPAAQLYQDEPSLLATSTNTIQLAPVADSVLSSWHISTLIAQIPGLWKNFDHLEDFWVQNIPYFSSMVEPKGLKIIDAHNIGEIGLYNSKRPVAKLEDAKGLKIRVSTGDAQVDSVNALGSNAIKISAAEVLTGLQQGLVDGVSSLPDSINSYKWDTIAKYGTNSLGLGWCMCPWVTGVTFWKSLPDDIRQKLEKEIIPATHKYTNKYQQDAWKSLADRQKAGGVIVTEVSPEEMVKFRKTQEPVAQKYTSLVGTDLVKKAIEAGAKYK